MRKPRIQIMKGIGRSLIAFALTASAALAADGFAVNVTGGEGGTTVTVKNASDFKTYVEAGETYIVQVSGTIDLAVIGGEVRIQPHKTIRGADASATIIGNLSFEDDTPNANVIIKRLNITNPDDYGDGDGISIKRVNNIFITHCTLYDCDDGCIDITREADNITVSWCKFYYTAATNHNFVNLIGGDDSHTADWGKLHITFHHNWFDMRCVERMLSVRYGRAHIYNNYYNCPGNNYCVRSRIAAECRIENNFFNGVNDPYYVYSTDPPDGKIAASGNMFVNCTGHIDYGTNIVFTPPYTYSLDSADLVPSLVQRGAGADGVENPLPLTTGLGAIRREWWTGISGEAVGDLTSNPNYPDNPSGSERITALVAPQDWANTYGTRLRGYLYPPTSGSYTFWIAGNDNSELWLSMDGDPANAVLIANVPGGTNPYEWDKYPVDQQSWSISLNANQKYYIEVLHKENSDSDNLAVAWQGPGIRQQVIPGIYLSPWRNGFYGDFTGDDLVDMKDLPIFFTLWLEDNCRETADLDLNGDCVIHLYEYSFLAHNWLGGIE